MNKWQYLMLDWANGVQIYPAQFIDQPRLAQSFPEARVKESYGALVVSGMVAYIEMVNFICGEGWEPFAIEPGHGYVHFKRPLPD